MYVALESTPARLRRVSPELVSAPAVHHDVGDQLEKKDRVHPERDR